MAEKQVSFEDNLKKLQETVNSLESGNVSLDKAIQQFKVGTGLATKLHAQLANAKHTIAHTVDSQGHETIYSRDENGQDTNNNVD